MQRKQCNLPKLKIDEPLLYCIISWKGSINRIKKNCLYRLRGKIIPRFLWNLRLIVWWLCVSVEEHLARKRKIWFSLLVRSRNLNSVDNDNVAGIFGFIHIIKEARGRYLSKHLLLTDVRKGFNFYAFPASARSVA
jgi:hypothetical protein